jgi:hypothetical protein
MPHSDRLVDVSDGGHVVDRSKLKITLLKISRTGGGEQTELRKK